MNEYYQAKYFERDKGIFKDYLNGMSQADIARKRAIGGSVPRKQIDRLLQELNDYLDANPSYPRPEGTDRSGHIANKEQWLQLLKDWIEFKEKTPIALITDSPLKIGVSERFCEKLKEINVNTIGELLIELTERKQILNTMLYGNTASMATLERRLKDAGFNPESIPSKE